MRQDVVSIFKQNKLLITDGAAGTHLESMGCDLNDALWTAKVLKDNPEYIKQLHKDYFQAGADFGVTVSYQATIEGYMKQGYSQAQAIDLIKTSALLLLDAREEWWQTEGKAAQRLYPIAAASIGPYGAFLADGSEYRGDYTLSKQALYEFHKPRIEILWAQGLDLIAAETIPLLEEALVIAQIVQELGAQCWISFSARNESQISNGQAIAECVEALEAFACVAAIGVNCTAPKYIQGLVQAIQSKTQKPIVVYANLGNTYDPDTKTWCRHDTQASSSANISYQDYVRQWVNAGVKIVGGCCGTTPQEIKQIFIDKA